MSKKVLTLLASLGFLLVGCSEDSEEYIPTHGGLVEPEAPKGPAEVTDSDFNDDATSIYEFYFSYSYSDVPLFTIEGPTFKALGNDKIPDYKNNPNDLIKLGEEKGYTVDPAFPTFIGWSFYGVCLDDDDLWDFSKDHKQLAVIPLYGIWVNK